MLCINIKQTADNLHQHITDFRQYGQRKVSLQTYNSLINAIQTKLTKTVKLLKLNVISMKEPYCIPLTHPYNPRFTGHTDAPQFNSICRQFKQINSAILGRCRYPNDFLSIMTGQSTT